MQNYDSESAFVTTSILVAVIAHWSIGINLSMVTCRSNTTSIAIVDVTPPRLKLPTAHYQYTLMKFISGPAVDDELHSELVMSFAQQYDVNITSVVEVACYVRPFITVSYYAWR